MVKLGCGHGRELNTVIVGSAWISMRIRKSLFSSVVDPDPYWIRIQWGPWTWIRIRIQGGKNDPQK
jgi:hypothetical protein